MNAHDYSAEYKINLDLGLQYEQVETLLTHITGPAVAASVVAHYGHTRQDVVRGLRLATIEELEQIKGVGPKKALAIKSAIALGLLSTCPPIGTIIDDPALAAKALSDFLMYADCEHFAVVILDIQHRLLGIKVISKGTPEEVLVHPRQVFKSVISHRGARCIVAHNHPSGTLVPSKEDEAMTRQLLQGAQVLKIPVLDHIIMGQGGYISLRQTTSLWQETPQP